MGSRNLAGSDTAIHRMSERIGLMRSTSPTNPSIFSSAGIIGRQFNPDGLLGTVPQALGGPFDKDGIIGSQFNAAHGGPAGVIERMVDGPSQARNPKTDTGLKNKRKEAECIRGERGRGMIIGRRNLRGTGLQEEKVDMRGLRVLR